MVAITRVPDAEIAGGVLIVEFDEAADLAVVLADLEPTTGEVRLDLSRLTAIDSAALSALIGFCVRMRSLQKQVVVDHASFEIHEVFQMTRFFRLATVRGNVSSAETSRRRSLFFRRRSK
jgi:anti-anti-sigma factor